MSPGCECAPWVDPLPCSLVLFHLLPLTSPILALSLQTELSLQKEQLQLKIIEIEDEAEKWQKEKDRIKVSAPKLTLLLPYPTRPAWKEAGLGSHLSLRHT